MLQRTPKWFFSRRGKITASRMGDVLAKRTTKRYRTYLLEVAYGIAGIDGFDLEPPWMAHGRDLEPRARALYEWTFNERVTEVGFIRHGALPYVGFSPDGLIRDGFIEIKSHLSFRGHLECALEPPPVYRPQIQAGLWVLQCERCDFVSFWLNGNRQAISRCEVRPDEKLHRRMETACAEFYEQAQEVAEQIRAKRRL